MEPDFEILTFLTTYHFLTFFQSERLVWQNIAWATYSLQISSD